MSPCTIGTEIGIKAIKHALPHRLVLPRTGATYLLRRGGSPPAVPGVRKWVGILAPDSDPEADADVIMTAAVVGHALERRSQGLDCHFGFEPTVAPNQDLKEDKDYKEHDAAVRKVNCVVGRGKDCKFVTFGPTPTHESKGGRESRITGGTGNLDRKKHAEARAHPQDPHDLAWELFCLARGRNPTPDVSRPDFSARLGYQGRGAYTGFIDGRKGGQTGLMTTYRLLAARYTGADVTDLLKGSRWIPKDKPGIGLGANQKIWGMIGSNLLQADLRGFGMYFSDSDPDHQGVGLDETDIVGYVHGMIQAIYNVELHGGKSVGGVPYEIAVGRQTSKLASCFPCSLFMEATGYPASFTHIGRGESWCIIDRSTSGSGQERSAHAKCNRKWASYCLAVLKAACKLLRPEHLTTKKHQDSLEHLRKRIRELSGEAGARAAAYLILDALTVHDSECNRINRTLKTCPYGESAEQPASGSSATASQKPSDKPGAVVQPCPVYGSLEVTVEGFNLGADHEVEVEISGPMSTRRPAIIDSSTTCPNCGRELLAPDPALDPAPAPDPDPEPDADPDLARVPEPATCRECARRLKRGLTRKTTFRNLKPGKYEVKLRYTQDLSDHFHPAKEESAAVKENATAKVTFFMERSDFIELQFVGGDGVALMEEKFRIALPEGDLRPAQASRSGKWRFEQPGNGECEVLLSDADWKASVL